MTTALDDMKYFIQRARDSASYDTKALEQLSILVTANLAMKENENKIAATFDDMEYFLKQANMGVPGALEQLSTLIEAQIIAIKNQIKQGE